MSQIGWDELLKTRSAVFVMEEEYRMQKAQADIHATNSSLSNNDTPNGVIIHEDGSTSTSTDPSEDDNASTRGMVSPHPGRRSDSIGVVDDPASGSTKVNGETETLNASTTIPTIRISTESDHDVEEHEEDAKVNGGTTPEASDNVTKPVQAAALEEEEQEAKTNSAAGGNEGKPEAFSFSNKRLCERWLDNLFMVLYEVKPPYFPSGPADLFID